MNTTLFYSKGFKIKGITIPEFELRKGELVRFYVPSYSILGFDLTLELIKHFQTELPNILWAKNYSTNRWLEYIRPMTIERFLVKKHRINPDSAAKIANEIGVSLKDKYEEVGNINRRALVIKALFENNEVILIDYHGVGAIGFKRLEKIVNTEIEKGKSAIAFDLLQYAEDKELFENIHRIKIKIPDDYLTNI